MIPLRLLMIEDSESDAGLVLWQLKHGGYEVKYERVEDAAQMRAALCSKWDVIIADFHLPDFDAPSALRILQESELDIPFIVVSGAIGEETAVELMKSGARDYVMKDKLSRLPPVIERELQEARNRQLQKQAHEALIASERNLKNSQRVAHIGHWIVDPVSGAQTWSDEMYRIFGIEKEGEGQDLNAVWERAVHPDDQERVFSAYDSRELIDNKIEMEFRIIRPDGTIRYLLCQYEKFSQSDALGGLDHSGVVHDITDRKQAELDLLEKMEESQRRANELETISLISSQMRSAETPNGLTIVVLQELSKLLHSNLAILSRIDDGIYQVDYLMRKQELVRVNVIEEISPKIAKFITPDKMGFYERIPKSIWKIVPRWFFEERKIEDSAIVYPITNQSKIIGLLFLSFSKGVQLNEEQKKLVEAVAEMTGNALNRMSVTKKLERMVEKRERELESIYKVTSSATSSLDIQQALKQAIGLTLDAISTDSGSIYLVEEHGTGVVQVASQNWETLETPDIIRYINRVASQEKAVVVSDIREPNDQASGKKEGNAISFIGLPMRAHDLLIGVLAVIQNNNDQVMLEEMTLLSFIADHLALVIENVRLFKQAERSAILEERSRLSRELHDSVTQSLYSASLYSAGARRFYEQNKFTEVNDYLSQIGQLTQQALKDMRLLVYELRSPELKRNGLIGALQNRLDAVERRANIKVEIKAEEYGELPEIVEENLYRIAIESLNNSLKHSQATKVCLKISQEGSDLVFAIEDNGIGFIPEIALDGGGVGLLTMHERADQIGASYTVVSKPGEGTKVQIRLGNLNLSERATHGED